MTTTPTPHDSNDEVISAFLDHEPFDSEALARALAEPGGRDLLIDLIALRQVVAVDPREVDAAPVTPRRSPWRPLAAAAALVVAIGGGYLAGHRTAPEPVGVPRDVPPAPTQVIDLRPGIEWHQTLGGN